MDLEKEVALWIAGLGGHGGIESEDAEEIESHLWDCITAEMYEGTAPDDAFRRATARLGEPRAIISEFEIHYREVSMELEKLIEENRDNPAWLEAQYHKKPQVFAACLARVVERFPDSPVLRAWKERLSYVPFRAERSKEIREIIVLAVLCAIAGVAVKLPAVWGVDFWRTNAGAGSFFLGNFSFFFLPMIALYYGFVRGSSLAVNGAVAAVFAASVLAVNLFPAFEPYQTRILSAVHLPLMLWLSVGTVFCGSDWRSPPARLDFLRSTGEFLIYTVLILLGGGVLTVFTLGIFQLIGMDIQRFYIDTIAVIGLFIAPILAAYLTEKKRELVERFAPVLSFIFTPLFLITLLVFLAAMLILGKSPYTDREFLIVFNGMLVLVLALVLFNITESKLKESTRIMDIMNGALILVAFAIDAVALSAIIVRLASYGASANRIAVLGENIILLANLLGLAFQYIRFYAGRARHAAVENWTAYFLDVYFIWFAVVVFLFPVIFRFA
jgi:hypothetical protein